MVLWAKDSKDVIDIRKYTRPEAEDSGERVQAAYPQCEERWISAELSDEQLSELLNSLEEMAQAKGLRREQIASKVPFQTQQEIDGKAEENETFKSDGSRSLSGKFQAEELSADPADPPEGEWVMWMSDGNGVTGDDGDVLVKITAGGSTKTTTLIDFSAL